MAIVKKYPSEVIEILNPLPDIYVVSFRSLDKPYKYMPGQFLHLALDDYDPSMPWPESRCFSMQSCGEDEFIKITYSVKGRYTARMAKELFVGRKVTLKLPYGELFIKNHPKENVVFIAGGTGVTPFLSLFNHDNFREYKNAKLYLGIRNENYHIYKEEIEKARKINESFTFEIICEDKEGMLCIEKIYNNHKDTSTYFISGPPLMIKNFKKYLLGKGLSEDRIRTDEWE